MALSFAHGAVQWVTTTALNGTYAVSGLGFQPKALRFYTIGIGSATDATSQATHARISGGFATGAAARQCVAVQDQDAAGSALCTTGYRDDCIAMTMADSATCDGRLDLSSIDSDGFTLIVDDVTPVDLTVCWEAWGGTDITVQAVGTFSEPAATGNQDYTVTGFTAAGTDQVVLFFGTQATGASPTAENNDAGFCAGFACGGADADNVVVAMNADDGSANMDCDRYSKSAECVAMMAVAGGNPSARGKLTQFGTDNFRINWLARAVTGRKYIYLAIKGGSWKVGTVAIDATTLNATATVSGLAFVPNGLSLISNWRANSVAGTSSTQAILAMGTASSTSSRRAVGYLSLDGAADADVNLSLQYDAVLTLLDTGTGGEYDIDLNALNNDGFQFIVDANNAGGSATCQIGYLTCGNVAAFMPPHAPIVRQAVNRAAVY